MASSDSEPPTKVLKLSNVATSNFSIPRHFSDVVFAVEGRKFHVHKSTLSMASPVFERMFSSSFKEKKAKEINLPGKKAEEFEVLLNLIYGFEPNKEVDGENYEFALRLADEYQIDKVKHLCSDYMCSYMSSHNSLEMFNVSHTYGLDDVMNVSLEYTANLTTGSMKSSPAYSEISDEAKVILLTKRLERLEKQLNDYASASSKVVDILYHAALSKIHPGFSSYECEVHQKKMENMPEGVVQKKKFDIDCFCCQWRVEKKWLDKCTGHLRCVKDPVVQLRKLNSDHKLTNISLY